MLLYIFNIFNAKGRKGIRKGTQSFLSQILLKMETLAFIIYSSV